MTRMLASVTDPAEADIAMRLGADIIDLKDAANGAMAAVDIATAEAVVAQVAGRRELSATLGDPPYEPPALIEKARAFATCKVDYLKAAVDANMLERCGEGLLATIARTARLVAVLFADEAPDFTLLPKLKSLGFAGAMLDTRRRAPAGCSTISTSPVWSSSARCVALKALTSGLAGSLEAPDVPRLMLVRPDVLGFRGALCHNHDRAAGLDPQCVSLIRDLIPRERPEPDASPKIDWDCWRAESSAARPRKRGRPRAMFATLSSQASDRRVQFRARRAATGRVRRRSRRPSCRSRHVDDMREVFSYDLILDSIRLAVGRGHVQFVETLAEEVAASVLRHARVRSVRVSVRKIDVIDGSVGIEIHRERASSAAENSLYDLASKDDPVHIETRLGGARFRALAVLQANVRASSKACRKSSFRGDALAAICLKRPASVRYLTLPIARAPTPSAPQSPRGEPLACRSSPSTPSGGTALTSAATSSFFPLAICAASSTRTPALAALSTISVDETIDVFFSAVEPSATAISTPKRRLTSSAWR